MEDEFRTKCHYMIVFVLAVVVGQEDARSRKTSGASLGCPNNVEHVCAPTQRSHGTFKQNNMNCSGDHRLAPLIVAPLKE